jgi:hypothetical protein
MLKFLDDFLTEHPGTAFLIRTCLVVLTTMLLVLLAGRLDAQ